MTRQTGFRILLALFIIAAILRILSFAGVLDDSVNGFLNGFVIGSAIALVIGWLSERA